MKYEKYCPQDKWRWKWDTADAQLTGPGYLEEAAIGNVTRADYGHLIGAYNGSRHIVRSAESDRVLQSAEIAMSFLFPPGTGPEHGIPGRPTVVPIHTTPESQDNVLTPEDAACEARADRDYDIWWEDVGAEVLQAGASNIKAIKDFCGKGVYSNKALKNQVDGIGFDRAQVVPQVSPLDPDTAVNVLFCRGIFAVKSPTLTFSVARICRLHCSGVLLPLMRPEPTWQEQCQRGSYRIFTTL